jgi:exonuclease III
VLNVNNMPKAGLKLVEVHHLLKEPRCDIMGFVETKEAQGKQLPADLIPGYIYMSKPRVVRAGERASGGVGVAVHASVANAVKVYDFADQQYDEAMWLVMPGQGRARKLFIGVVYMPDMGKTAPVRSAAYTALQEDLEYLSSRGSVVVMGDFNARVGSASGPTQRIGMHGETTVNENGRLLLSLLDTTNLYSLNARTVPTSPHQQITCDRSHGGTRRGSLLITSLLPLTSLRPAKSLPGLQPQLGCTLLLLLTTCLCSPAL